MISEWKKRLAVPENYTFEHSLKLLKKYEFEDCDAELYLNANGPGTFQRLLKVFPKNLKAAAPAVAVPFYFPEAMIGFELESLEPLPAYAGITMMRDLAKRGIITASADSYHLTYLNLDLDRGDYFRWVKNGEALRKDYPNWFGMGKLIADTKLVIDALANDSRVDAARLGIAGHSLGGKMAFYTGCLDSRVKAILASDFGFGWDQTNWNDIWYWGDEVETMKALGMEHYQLLEYCGCKPFCVLAGQYDNDDSLKLILKAEGYRNNPENLCFLNHATGHRPPNDYLNQAYDYLLAHI